MLIWTLEVALTAASVMVPEPCLIECLSPLWDERHVGNRAALGLTVMVHGMTNKRHRGSM